MELSEKIMVIARKNDDVMERVEMVQNFLELVELHVSSSENKAYEAFLTLFADDRLSTVSDNLRRVLNVLEDNSVNLVKLSESTEVVE